MADELQQLNDTDEVNASEILSTIDFRSSLAKSKWQSKEEATKVATIRDRWQTMRRGRSMSCYWARTTYVGDPNNYQQEAGRTVLIRNNMNRGSDWKEHWDRCYKMWSMWHDYPTDGTPNIKSPITFAPVEAMMAEFVENNVGVNIFPTTEDDKEKAKIIKHTNEYVERHCNMGMSKAETMRECAITGTAWSYNCWLDKRREVEIIMNEKEMDEKIKKAIEKDDEDLKSIEKAIKANKPITKKKTIIEYNDVAYIPVSVYEIWVDPSARCLRGPTHEATDLIWRTIMSMDQIKATIFKSSDPYIIQANFDKIVTAKKAAEAYETRAFFTLPRDLSADDEKSCEVIRYYNKQTDKYCICINDVLVRDGPLPYNHKELPFSIHRLITFPYQLYGIGLAAMLESTQAEDEASKNGAIRLNAMAQAPPLLINKNAVEFEEQFDYPDLGQIVEMTAEVDARNIRWLEMPQLKQDFQILRNILQEEAVKISGINPIAYSTPRANEPVRNNMMATESTVKMIKKMVKSWADGYKDAVKQRLAIMQQRYTEDRLIRLNGIELEVGGNGVLQEKKIKGYSFFKVKPKYFDLKGDPDISIDIDTLVPMTQGLKMQNATTALNVLSPHFLNPAAMSTPAMHQLLRNVIEEYDLGDRLLETLDDESSIEDVKLAVQQENQIMNGLNIQGFPGESQAHKIHHLHTFYKIVGELADFYQRQSAQPQKIDPMTGQPMPPQPSQDILNKENIKKILGEHMVSDNEPKGQTGQGTRALTQPPPPMPPQIPQGMPIGMPPEGMPMEGTQISPDQLGINPPM